MSLQIWLPLNGDLKNLGLSTSIFTNSGATINDVGKIGKCYNFASGNFLLSTLSLSSTGPWSAAAWICPAQDTSSGHLYIIGLNGSSASDFLFTLCIYSNKISVRFAGTTYQATTNYTINTWYHACFTYDGTQLKIYINGILNKTFTSTVAPVAATNIYIGKRGGNTGYYVGKLNDVRIYDHCLSVKEVKEIAKGLVLHYLLNNNGMGGNNFLGNSNATAFTISPWTNWGTVTSRSIEQINGKSWFHLIANGSNYGGYSQNSYSRAGYEDVNFKPNTTYTISATWFASTTASCRFWFHMRSSEGGNNISLPMQTITVTTVPTKFSFTFNSGTNANYTINRFCIMMGTLADTPSGTDVYFTDVKMEEGSIATAWSPNPADLDIDSSITYDSSGYSNNGIITGDIQTDGNTARYSCSTKQINGQYIRVEKRPAECMPKDAITVNIWQYATTWSNPISCTEGGGWNFENNNGIRFPVYISGVGYKVAQSTITPASTLNAWHMLTGTMDKDNVKIYYDGEEVGTITKDSTNGIGYANNYIFIGGEAGGNTTTPASSLYAGNISDVRIYATALSAEDILELYKTSKIVSGTTVTARDLE